MLFDAALNPGEEVLRGLHRKRGSLKLEEGC